MLAVLGATSEAMAESTSLGISVTSDRQEQDLGVPQSTKVDISASHTFDVGVILGASVQYSDTAFSNSATANLETTAGYRVHFNDIVSVKGSVGVGARMQVSGDGDDIAYYVLRAEADIKLNNTVTWNAIAFRYRDAFDVDDDYLTPQLATGFTFKLDEHNSVSSKVQYNWKDWNPDTIGFELSYAHSF
ncbi:hypothetical protein [Mesorhizobium onobrychidis]|uniref:Outer membrane beta-barrel protein n=1 Tax=Mesorhizobium onobrychidis TaxID=2775404 RepID=A0ABY5QVG5_9HYPH|nr:hypothetical protein [Mesorhizobium onobrychidis]UVC14447.1 outer membrane beta-barrel protein [Mesorhizobium onobrychidis]